MQSRSRPCPPASSGQFYLVDNALFYLEWQGFPETDDYAFPVLCWACPNGRK